MDVAELVSISPDVVAEATLIQLHMVYIVEDLEFGKPMSRVVSAAMRVVWRKFPTWSVVTFKGSRFIRTPDSSASLAYSFKVSNMAQSFTVSLSLS